MTYVKRQEFSEIMSLLAPHVGTKSDRQALITPLFNINPDLYNCIDWSGDAVSFSARLIELLLRYGEVEPNKSALLVLLEGLRGTVGIDVQRRIDALVDRLEKSPLCDSPDSEHKVEVFLGYSSQDRLTAQNLRKALVEAGISVWQDEERIQAGSYFSLQIEHRVLHNSFPFSSQHHMP
jgi:hypothetical protein